MAADEGEAHLVGHTDSLIDHTACLHTAGSRHGAGPLDVVLDNKQTPRGGQGRHHMIALRHSIDLSPVSSQALRGPHVLGYDFVGRLDIRTPLLFGVRDTPASSAAGPELV